MADRFVRLEDGAVVDLATGGRITYKRLPAAPAADELAWAAACSQLLDRRDARSEGLLDFGAVGHHERFEAWTCGTPSLRVARDEESPRANVPLAALIDAIDDAGHGRARMIAIFAREPGRGLAVLLDAARHARLKGIVPVTTALLGSEPRPRRRRAGADLCVGPPLDQLLQARSLFLIHQGPRPGGALVDAVLRSPRPHLLVCLSAGRVRGVDMVVLPEHEILVPKRQPLLRAAEQPVPYGASTDEVAGAPRGPAPPDLVVWRRRADDAEAKLDAGRHAGGERLLRHAIGGLTRRGDWLAAGDALNRLARALLKRGRPRDALSEVERARDVLARAPDEGRLIDSAILAGRARLQLARLDEAEGTFGAALTASTTAGDAARTARASAALANVLLWQGRYVEAGEVAARTERTPASESALGTVRAIAFVGAGQLREAVSAAAEVADRARSLAQPAATARAAALAAFAHLALGDLDPATRELDIAARAAAAAGDRLLVVRCRLLAAEAARRRNRHDAAASLVGRLSKVGDTTLPPLLRAHVRLLGDLLAASDAPHAIAERHAKATGLFGLQLLVPPRRSDTDPPVVVDDLLDIVQACQSADDEGEVLREVCRRSRARLHAASVAIYTTTDAGLSLAASDGGRVDGAIAERAVAAGLAIEPHQHDGRIEGAVPVQYGGATVGVVAARWPLASPYPRARSVAVLTTIAAAAGPAVAMVRVRQAVPAPCDLIGVSSGARDLREAIDRAARAPFAVLIDGESGSGKELVARALHRGGPRRDRPFCTLNCAALPEDLVESELFGHSRGAFTGAAGDRAGVFEEAHTGTLFLDEVGELSARAQAKLLRVVQEGELRRIGENVSRRVDVRLVAATNRDLRREADAGRFRTDLLYRLDVVRISVPPLRERREDIALLVEHFWRDATARVGSRAVLSAGTLAALARYDWPGNVRELQNVLASLAVRVGRRGLVGPAALPPLFDAGPAQSSCRLDEARRQFEERFVRAALVRSGGRRLEAAAELGVSRQGLAKLMARLGIGDS